MAGTGEFDVRESGSVVASGYVKIQTSDEQMQLPEIKSYETDQLLTADIYRDLACKGYKYSETFQGINVASNNGTVMWFFFFLINIVSSPNLINLLIKLL